MTVHGFILTAIGITLTKAHENFVAQLILVVLPVFGLSFCQPWREYVAHGTRAQDFFRAKAQAIEKQLPALENIFTELPDTVAVTESKRALPESTFEDLSSRVIRLFQYPYGGLVGIFLMQHAWLQSPTLVAIITLSNLRVAPSDSLAHAPLGPVAENAGLTKLC